MKKDLFLAPSLYSLFLYTLINEDWTESDYILSDRIPLAIHDSLRSNFDADVYTYVGSKRISPLKRFKLFNNVYFNFKRIYKNRKYERVWGNDDFTPSFLYREQGMILIEDGSFNTENKSFIKKRQFKHDVYFAEYWFKWVFKHYTPYGWSDAVNVIYHTDSVKLPEEIGHKGSSFNLEDKWNSLSDDRKSDILKLFGISSDFIKDVNKFSTILITQELPIPDEDKLEIYKQMLDGYDLHKVLIKTHYAEKTDYKKIFPEAEVITLPVPMQIFGLLGYSPKVAMTISSSAITPYIRDGVEILFKGTECDRRLVDKYGVITLETYMNKSK